MILKIADYPVQFDDQYYLSLKVLKKFAFCSFITKAAICHWFRRRPFPIISGLLSRKLVVWTISLCQIQTYCIGRPAFDLQWILLENLAKAMSQGTNLFIFPAEQLNDAYSSLESTIRLPQLSEFTKQKKEVGSINYESGLFDDVFTSRKGNIILPFVLSSYSIKSHSFMELIMTFRDG